MARKAMSNKPHTVTVGIVFTTLLGLCLAFAFLHGCSDRSRQKTVKIAVFFPFSGRTEVSASWAKKGAQMAIDEINSRGGAAGYRFEAIFVDDKSRPLYAERMAEKLIAEEKVEFFLGVLSSEVAMKITEVSRKEKKIFMGTAHASPSLTMEYFQPYYFSIRKNSFQAMAAGALFLKGLRESKHWHSISYIGPDYAYGHETYETFLYNLKRFQVRHKLLSVYWPKLYTRDYTPFITSILRDKPDVLVVDLYAGDFKEFVRQGNSKNLFSRIITCSFVAGGHYENFHDTKEEIPLGMYLSGSNFLNWPATEANREFVKKTKNATGGYPYAILQDTYNGIKVLARAVEMTGAPQDSEAMVKAIENMELQMPGDPEGFVSRIHVGTHQIVQTVAIGEVTENRDFPPAIRMPGNWRAFKAEDLMPPLDYILERRRRASKGGVAPDTTRAY